MNQFRQPCEGTPHFYQLAVRRCIVNAEGFLKYIRVKDNNTLVFCIFEIENKWNIQALSMKKQTLNGILYSFILNLTKSKNI